MHGLGILLLDVHLFQWVRLTVVCSPFVHVWQLILNRDGVGKCTSNSLWKVVCCKQGTEEAADHPGQRAESTCSLVTTAFHGQALGRISNRPQPTEYKEEQTHAEGREWVRP